jgi:Outer membrane protein/protective antigen OMA87
MHENFGLTQSVVLQHVRDTRDNVFNPTKGNRYSLATEFAGGGFGGDFTFNKYTAEGRKILIAAATTSSPCASRAVGRTALCRLANVLP